LPVTARLSKKFYEQFGDPESYEIVDWFNSVDATYQAQVKEINEANRTWADARFAALDARMDARFAAIDARMDAFEARMATFEARMEAKFNAFRAEMVLWMFGFWTATVLPLAALELALHGAFSK
jgi:hypothetical protein